MNNSLLSDKTKFSASKNRMVLDKPPCFYPKNIIFHNGQDIKNRGENSNDSTGVSK